MRWHTLFILTIAWAGQLWGADSTTARREQERALLAQYEISASQLMPLRLSTALVQDGHPTAVICPADEPEWRAAAEVLQQAIAETTGVTLPIHSAGELSADAFAATNAILLGHLDNHRWVARLYHQFFVCLDAGFTGTQGYELRTVHDPFGTGHNYVLCGGSAAAGTRVAAERLATIIRAKAIRGRLELGRLLEVVFDPQDNREPPHAPLTEKQRDDAVANGRRLFASPGQGRSAAALLVERGIAYHRTGDPRQGEAYRDLLRALLHYYRTDAFINGEGMARYDADFRDAWTWEVTVLWDLLEESGLFSDQERLDFTNLVLRLALESGVYQRWHGPEAVKRWSQRNAIAHNHLTFPALGLHFAGTYFQRHYHAPWAADWQSVAQGVFRGQQTCGKPQEDAALYQWLVIIHTMVYSLAQDDPTFFQQQHARYAARLALMCLDNSGNQPAFGDNSALRGAGALAAPLQIAGWYYRDPAYLWGAALAGRDHWFPLGQLYASNVKPQPPADQVGVTVAPLLPPTYAHAAQGPYPTKPNLPLEKTFDKLTLRGGCGPDDEYLLLDGFGRGNHMHFDGNAIISYAAGGQPLLVDAEYIKNAPKYHNSLLVVRDGVGENLPAVTGLGRAEQLQSTACTRTWVEDYNGATWTRTILWRRGDYLLVSDDVQAVRPGDYTLRCCWRPWGAATLHQRTLDVRHPPLHLAVCNADASALRVETLREAERMPISCFSQQVNRRLEAGQHYRFVNVVHAEPEDYRREFRVRQVGDGLVVVERSNDRNVVCLGPQAAAVLGIETDAEALVLTCDGWVAIGCTRLALGGQTLLAATGPISCEMSTAGGRALILAAAPARVTLRPRDGAEIIVQATAGRNEASFKPFQANAACQAAIERAAALPDSKSPPADQPAARPAVLRPVWTFNDVPKPVEPLPIVKLSASVPPLEKPGPLERLIDGRYANSTDSARWAPGVAPTITAELAAPAEIHSVVLREWQFGAGNELKQRVLELSNDGFAQDIRRVSGDFRKAGVTTSGTNVNTTMEIAVGQSARFARVTLTPAQAKNSVYLAEIELRGAPEGRVANITAATAGHLGASPLPAVVVATAGGDVQAVSAEGRPLWQFTSPRGAAIRAARCLDIEGKGSDCVALGDESGRLWLLDGMGRQRWQTELPKYRGMTSDVRTIFAADVDGSGVAKIACGATSWQYFVFDAQGAMLWKHVMYAHAATVGVAADLDGDRRQEVLAANTYYNVNAISPDGKRLWTTPAIGPETTALAAADLDGDDRPAVIAGVDSGDLHAFDARGKARWKINLGDRVTAIMPTTSPQGKPWLVCAAQSGNLFAIDAQGKIAWRCPLPDGAQALATGSEPGDPFAVAAGSAGVIVVDRQGRVVARGTTEGQAENVFRQGRMLVVLTDRGVLQGFALEKTP